MSAPTIITFYTPEYSGEVDELEKSAKKVGLRVISYPRKSKGTWVKNCTIKPEVIKEALKSYDSVLWVDADARFKSTPNFAQLSFEQYDFGAYWIPNVWNQRHNEHLRPWPREDNHALAGGTMYFNKTPAALRLLDAWEVESSQNPMRWEQQSLQKVWHQADLDGLKTLYLSQAWCKVFDCPWFDSTEPIIIEHTQASRRLKGKIR